VYALVHVPAFIVGTALFGLTGAIWSIVLAGVFYTYLNVWLLRHTLGISLGEITIQLRRPFGAAMLMVGAVAALGFVFPIDLFSEHGSWYSLIIKSVVGGLVFWTAQFVFWRMEGCPEGIERRVLQVLSRGSAG